MKFLKHTIILVLAWDGRNTAPPRFSKNVFNISKEDDMKTVSKSFATSATVVKIGI